MSWTARSAPERNWRCKDQTQSVGRPSSTANRWSKSSAVIGAGDMPYPTSFNSVMRDNVMRMRPVFQQTSRPMYSNDRCTGNRDGRRFIQTATNAPRPPPTPSSPAPLRIKEELVAAGNSSNFLDTGQPHSSRLPRAVTMSSCIRTSGHRRPQTAHHSPLPSTFKGCSPYAGSPEVINPVHCKHTHIPIDQITCLFVRYIRQCGLADACELHT